MCNRLAAIGRRHPHVIDDRDTAVAGMRTACGAILIASQSSDTIDDAGEGSPSLDAGVAVAAAAVAAEPPLSPSPTLCLECLKTAAESGATTVMRG